LREKKTKSNTPIGIVMPCQADCQRSKKEKKVAQKGGEKRV